MFWAFFQMFVFCDLGEKLTKRFTEIDSAIYYCEWYTFPVDIQRLLPITMMAAQDAVLITGFANLSCTRQAFKKVEYSIYIIEIFFDLCSNYRLRMVDFLTLWYCAKQQMFKDLLRYCQLKIFIIFHEICRNIIEKKV